MLVVSWRYVWGSFELFGLFFYLLTVILFDYFDKRFFVNLVFSLCWCLFRVRRGFEANLIVKFIFDCCAWILRDRLFSFLFFNFLDLRLINIFHLTELLQFLRNEWFGTSTDLRVTLFSIGL